MPSASSLFFPYFRLVSPNGASGKGLNECVLQFRRIHKVNFCQATSFNGFSHLIFLPHVFPMLQISRVKTVGKIARGLLSILFSFVSNFHMLRSISNSIDSALMKSY